VNGPTRERPHIEVLLAENGKLHSELRQVKREAKADSKRLDKYEREKNTRYPARINHVNGHWLVFADSTFYQFENLREAIDKLEEPHE
jgi:hypothetical protein